MDEFPQDWTSPKGFHDAYPNVHTSMDSLRWELRFRHDNGLIRDGVVVERRADPRATRPSLLISPSRYFAWLRKQSQVA